MNQLKDVISIRSSRLDTRLSSVVQMDTWTLACQPSMLPHLQAGVHVHVHVNTPSETGGWMLEAVPAPPGADQITLSLPVEAVISWKMKSDVTDGARGGGAAKAEDTQRHWL